MAEAVSSAGFNFLDWLQKPGSQNLLAGIGSRLDPQGVGAALGGATVAYNQSRVAEERATAQEKLRNEQNDAIKKLALSPPGSPGPTKIEAKKDGAIQMLSDVGTSNFSPTAPQAPGSGVLLPPQPAAATQTPGSGVLAPTAAVPPATQVAAADPYARTVPQFDIRQILPFS